MAVRLVTGSTAEAACRALTEADHALTAIRAHGTDADYFLDYSRWAVEQARSLRSLVASPHLNELILTRRHTLLQKIGSGLHDQPETPHLRLLIATEIEERHAAITHAATELRREHESWSTAGAVVLPDTNVYLQHHTKFDEIPWPALLKTDGPVTVVAPIVVIRELDGKKLAGHKQMRFRASYSLSTMERLFDGKSIDAIRPVMTAHGPIHLRVTFDALGHQPLHRADDEIISHALTLQSWSGRPVTLVTFDTNMSFMARQTGLPAIKLLEDDLHEAFRQKSP